MSFYFFFVKNSIDSAWNATLVYYVNIGIFSFNYLRDGTKRIKYLESYLWFMYFNLIKIIFMLKFFNDLRSVVNKLLRLYCQSVCMIKLLYSIYFHWKSRGSFIKAKVVYVEFTTFAFIKQYFIKIIFSIFKLSFNFTVH